MQWLTTRLEKFYNKKIDGTGLALFRISFCFVMFLEILRLFYFYGMMFNSITMAVPLFIWLVVTFMLMIGALTPIMKVANYALCMTIIISQFHGYHMNYAYFGTSFLFLFLPISNNISVDSLLKKLKYSNISAIYKPSKKVTALAYYLPLFLIPGLIYFESAVNWKLISPVWLKGIGMWLPGSTPYLVYQDLSFILNQKYLNLVCGYVTVFFEVVFIFIFWFKKFRWPLFVVGLGLHIGIFIFFPIPLFAIGMSCFYFLLLPVSLWSKVLAFFSSRKKTRLKFYYDSECPLCLRTRIIIEHFDILNRIEFLSVQEYSDQEKAFEKIPQDILLKDIYSVNSKGKVYVGVDTYIQVMYVLRYTFLIGLFLSIPGIYHIAKYVYKRIAGARYTQRCTEASCSVVRRVIPQETNNEYLFMNYTIGNFKVDLLKWGVIFMLIVQLFISWNYGLMSKVSDHIGLKEDFTLRKIGRMITPIATMTFGLGTHPVYMDQSFYGYELKFSYVEPGKQPITLPMINDNGMAGWYIYGPNYVSFLFNCVSKSTNVHGRDLVSTFDEKRINDGIYPWIKFWAIKNNIDPKKGIFLVEIKEFKIAKEWEKDYLKKARSKPWVLIGDFKFNFDEDIKINYNEIGKKYLGKTIYNDL